MKFTDINQIIEHVYTNGIDHDFLEVIAYDCDLTITTTFLKEKTVYSVLMDIVNEFGGSSPRDVMYNAVKNDNNLSFEDVINYVLKELPNGERFTLDFTRTIVREKAKENGWEFVYFPFDTMRDLNDEKEEIADMLAEIANVPPFVK